MLRELRVRNFLLIESANLELGEGLTVISGESGSGKSMLLQALEGALGRRLSQNIIREGAEEAIIEALFDLSHYSKDLLSELPEQFQNIVGELVIRRIISRNGRTKISVNGDLVSQAMLEALAKSLMTIASQREHMKLLERSGHILILDAFALTFDLKAEYQDKFCVWREISKQLEEIERRLNDSAFKRVELVSILEELNSTELREGIRQELEDRVSQLSATDRSVKMVGEIQELLRQEGGAIDQVRVVTAKLHDLSRSSATLSSLAERATSIREELLTLDGEIAELSRSSHSDTRELSKARDHLAEVARLERKYRASDRGLIELKEKVSKELEFLDQPDGIEKLRISKKEIEDQLNSLALNLSKQRRLAAVKLSKKITNELSELGMVGSLVDVRCTEVTDAVVKFGPDGVDRVEIFISTSKGGVLRPVQEVASGGELARIFLAVKKILGETGHSGALVFDEIDTGVSGKTARVVGEKLREISKDVQVICITHLPQVASLADTHIVVERDSRGGRTTEIRVLAEKERVDEVARMIAGHKITESARASAIELMRS